MPSSLNQSGQFTDCSSLTAVVHRKHLMADVIRHPDAQKLKELPELMVVQRSLTVLAPPHYNIHYFIHKISIFKDGIQAASACSPRLLLSRFALSMSSVTCDPFASDSVPTPDLTVNFLFTNR
jgi:hypothetical protein